MRYIGAALVVLCLFANIAAAGQISFGGTISQSTPDGTGPAINNLTLNMIADGDAYTVTVNFTGSISGLGTYPLAGVSMTFLDTTKSVSETSFTPLTSASRATLPAICFVVSADGTFDDISVLACPSTGSACNVGNQLDANFKIPAAGLNSRSVAAIGLDQPHPLDLLEDDGTADIQDRSGGPAQGAAAIRHEKEDK